MKKRSVRILCTKPDKNISPHRRPLPNYLRINPNRVLFQEGVRSTYCSQVGGWNSTEMPFYLETGMHSSMMRTACSFTECRGEGACVAVGGGHACYRACMVRGIHGRGDVHDKGHAWWWGHAWWGCAWQGVCGGGVHAGVAWWRRVCMEDGGMHGRGACVACTLPCRQTDTCENITWQ